MFGEIMPKGSYDPAGHLKLSVSDIDKSRAFYSGLFKKLGFRPRTNDADNRGWITREGFGISIAEASSMKPKHVFGAPGFHHLCLKARSTEGVDAIYELVKEKTRVFDKPQKYPEYSPKYYAVFFADPDGMKIEVAYY
jgi:catechol 2,3-dioxygenase-like lactoylglutathione lyase family enzyme